MFRDDPFSSKRYDIKWRVKGQSMELALNDMIRLSPLIDKVKPHPFTYQLVKFDDLSDSEKLNAESGLCFKHNVNTPEATTTTSSAEKRKLQSTSTISPEQSTLVKKIKPSDSLENLTKINLPRVSFSKNSIDSSSPSTSRNPESVTIPNSSMTLQSDSKNADPESNLSKFEDTKTSNEVNTCEENQHSKISEEFNCVICTELLIPPVVMTSCGHNFCAFCLESWMNKNIKDSEEFPACPTCGEKITTKIKAYSIENCIAKLEEKMNAEEREDRVAAKEERQLMISYEKEKKKKKEEEEKERIKQEEKARIVAKLQLEGK